MSHKGVKGFLFHQRLSATVRTSTCRLTLGVDPQTGRQAGGPARPQTPTPGERGNEEGRAPRPKAPPRGEDEGKRRRPGRPQRARPEGTRSRTPNALPSLSLYTPEHHHFAHPPTTEMPWRAHTLKWCSERGNGVTGLRRSEGKGGVKRKGAGKSQEEEKSQKVGNILNKRLNYTRKK